MPKPIQDVHMLCLAGGDLAELRRNAGIIKELAARLQRAWLGRR
jgi:hypothetical protein